MNAADTRRASRRGERRLLTRGRQGLVALGPAVADELLEALGARAWSSGSRCDRTPRRRGARSWSLVSLVLAMSSILAPLQEAGSQSARATTGRWSLPEPSTSPTTRNASTCQPGVASTWSIGAAEQLGRSVGQVPSPPAAAGHRGIPAPAEVAAVDAATGEVVDGRVEVAGHDHVLAGALLGEPVEVAAPVAQLPADRGDRVHRDDAGSVAARPARRRSTGACSCSRAARARAPRPPRSRRGRAR